VAVIVVTIRLLRNLGVMSPGDDEGPRPPRPSLGSEVAGASGSKGEKI